MTLDVRFRGQSGHVVMSSRCWGLQRLDTSTQGEYTKSKAACENVRDFNESER